MRPFSYARVADTAEALQRGVEAGSAYLAGGTTLLDLAKLDVLRPSQVVDINGLRGRHGRIVVDSSGLRLGALARMSEAAEHLAVVSEYPVIAQSLQLAASQQIRNMASLGGNLLQRTRCSYFRDVSWDACNKRAPGSGCAAMEGVNRGHAVLGTSDRCIAAYPGDFAQALVALEATARLSGPDGERILLVEDLHRAPGDSPHLETVLRPGELIVGLHVPARPWTRRSVYLKVRDRQSFEFAAASAAVALQLDGQTVRHARVGLGGVATRPWRSHEAEAALTGRPLTEAVAQEAAEAAFAGAVTNGGNDRKPELGRRTLVRALLDAARMEA